MSLDRILVPPIKIQGIKTKLISLIKKCARLKNNTTWVEPFMGSGVVGFNLAGVSAVFSDLNPHIISFYQYLNDGRITAPIVREFLEENAPKLKAQGVDFYLFMRERFNAKHDPLDFLFLNRSCFNGMIRFNRRGGFNVPYGHKSERFAKAYITKIVNQVAQIEQKMQYSDWRFCCQSFEKTIAEATPNSFVYCDPPYIGRHVDYFDSWNEGDERALFRSLSASNLNYMLSTWDHNEYRANEYVNTLWSKCHKVTQNHYYHVGAREENRKPMVEALLVNYDLPEIVESTPPPVQMQLELFATPYELVGSRECYVCEE